MIDNKYDPDKLYNNPYSKEEEHKLTYDCYMDLLAAVSEIVSKHFEGKIVTPRMYMNIFAPILSTVIKIQFSPVPKEIRDKIYDEFYEHYTHKLRLLFDNMKEEKL